MDGFSPLYEKGDRIILDGKPGTILVSETKNRRGVGYATGGYDVFFIMG